MRPLIVRSRCMLHTRYFTIICLSFLVARISTPSSCASEIAAGPLFHQFRLTLDPGHRTEAIGPFYYQQTSGEENDITRTWAVPPIFSRTLNDDTDYEFYDFLWKGVTYARYGKEYRLQILQWISFAGGQTQSETNVHRFTLFPFYFQQRSKVPEKNYTALLPIYGNIKGRFFRDDIKLVLFPLYGQSTKRDVVTDNYLYPFFHLRHGDGLTGWQFWPLFGSEHKDVTTRTNAWGDTEIIGGHDKRFILWPLFFDQRASPGTTNEAHQQALLPFYNYLRSPQRDSTSWLWPFGVTHTVDRARRFSEWGAPWPLIVFTRGEGKNVNRVWPLFSKARNSSQSSGWYLWPVYKYNRIHAPPLERERRRVLFFLYSDLSVKHTETGQHMRQFDLWPLFTSRRELDGRHRLQILAPLEPFLPNNTSVQRDLSPLWSIWRSEENPRTGGTSRSLLWNLYRRDTTPETRKCSLLFGLIQYQSTPAGRHWRVFHIPARNTSDAGTNSPSIR